MINAGEACATPAEAGQLRPVGFVLGSVLKPFFEPLAEDELAAWECET